MPTYRLLIGIPGKSNAFAISRRLGLSEEIIASAGDLLESNDIKFEDMLSDLELKRHQIETEKMEIDRLHLEIQNLEKQTQGQGGSGSRHQSGEQADPRGRPCGYEGPGEGKNQAPGEIQRAYP